MDKIFEIKLMKNRDTGEGKGFAFVAFKAKEVAQQAIEELHNKEFKGRTLRCSLSEAQHRLFIGNVPKTWTDDEFRKVIEVTGPGAAKTLSDLQNPSQNRGFAFVEYDNNACADYSRQKTSSANFKMDGNAPTVSWADPKNVPDNSAAVSQCRCGTLIGSSKDEHSNQDVATSDAIKLAREVDPNGERTFGITGHHGTILLGAEWGRDRTNALDVLEGRSYRLQHPWVGIVNRSQADINRNVDMLDARRREREFFATNPDYGHSASRMATRVCHQAELNHLGRTVSAQLYTILELCCAFDRIFKEHLDGWNKETNGFLKREVSPKTGSRVLCSNIKERKEEEVERTNSMKKGLFLVMGQQSLIYSFVARGTVVLAEFTEFTGNFTSIASQCLQKLPSSNNKFTYNCDGHTFNYLVEDGFTYCVVAVESAGRQIPMAFLERVKEDFTKRYGGGKAATAAANSLNREFGPKLKEQIQYCVDHPEEISKLSKVKAQVSEVKGVMMENIEKVLDRGEKIELLVDKTENLRSQVQDFRTQGTQMRRKMWLQNMKIKLIVLDCEQVKQLFQRYGEVSKVVMPPAKSGGKRNFGFIHYAERSSALKAVKDAEKYEIDGQELEVCLAKPQSDKKFDWTNPYISGPHPNYIPHPGYGGFPGNPYGSLGGEYGVATGFQQVYWWTVSSHALAPLNSLIYGRGPVLERMHMIPMVLPDGRTGYVLQQPGVQMPLSQPHKNDWSNSSSGTSSLMATVADGIDTTRQ
ncbi:unnamed protein product [Camellia sinensis]